jgi:hypothetical protein
VSSAQGHRRFDRGPRLAKNDRVLVEYKGVKQESGGGSRRWFEDQSYELVVWYLADGSVEGFQILYFGKVAERALTWRKGEGFTHCRIDNGTESPMKNLAPVLLPIGKIPWTQVVREFEESSEDLEPELREFVKQRLEARQ